MRLTFFGSSLVSAYWNGAATYYRGLLRALADLGHDIVFCEPDAYERQAHRDLPEDPTYARVALYRTPAERNALLREALHGSDWVVKCSGVGVWDEELEAAVAGDPGWAERAFWDVDAPATLERMRRDPGDRFRALVPRFSRVFTYGGGPPVVDAYLGYGARACVPIYNALDPEEHRPLEAAVEPRWDLLFMGNRLPDREGRVEAFFFRAAEAVPEGRFALGGSGWAERRLPPNVECLGHVPTGEHNRVNGSARLVLNVHRESMVENGWSPATRMFEAAGAGACQVTDVWRGLEDFFRPGREVLVARSGEDVARWVREVDAETATRIGEAARRRALRDHTYALRARDVDRLLRDPEPGRKGAAPSLARGDAVPGLGGAA